MALGWKERFVSPLEFFFLDVGIGKPKHPPPLAVLRARVGRHNDPVDLPELPVRLPCLLTRWTLHMIVYCSGIPDELHDHFALS